MEGRVGRSSRIVVVGGGQAGGHALSSLRRGGFEGELFLVTAEDEAPYERPPLSKDYLAGRCERDRLRLYPDGFYVENAIELVTGTRAVAIDPGSRRVELESGRVLHYDQILLATGSRVRRLADMPGSRLDRVFYLRTIEDAERIRAAMKDADRIAVVGGGYIGLEVASIAVETGLPATVIETMPRLLTRVMTSKLSAFYADLHGRHGVDLRLGTAVTGFHGSGAVKSVALADGSKIAADLVVVGIGIEPITDLARAAGIDCDNGIVVDRACRTSCPDVLAAGDCSSRHSSFHGRRVRLESVANATAQGQIAASAMLGVEGGCDAVPWFWSDQHGVRLQMAGVSEGADRTVVRGTFGGDSFVAFHLCEGVLIGVDAVNSMREFSVCRRLVEKRRRPDPAALSDTSVPLKSLL